MCQNEVVGIIHDQYGRKIVFLPLFLGLYVTYCDSLITDNAFNRRIAYRSTVINHVNQLYCIVAYIK